MVAASGVSVSQNAASSPRVLSDLIDHRFLRLEPFLWSLEGDQLRFNGLAIDVRVEVKQMHLHPGRDDSGCRIDADVGDARQLAAVGEPGLRGVDSQAGPDILAELHVGRWETQ